MENEQTNSIEIENTEDKKIVYEVQIERPFRFGKMNVKMKEQIFEEFTKHPVDGFKFLMCGKARGHLTIPEVQRRFKKSLKRLEESTETPSKIYGSFLSLLLPPNVEDLTPFIDKLEASVEIVRKTLEEKIMEKPEVNIKELFDNAFKKFEVGDYKGAIGDYSRVLEVDKNNVSALYNRGVSRQNIGNFKAAIKDFTRVIELKPKFAQGYNNRGVCYRKMDDNVSAIKDFDNAVELNPDYTVAYYNRALAKKSIKDIIGEIDDLNKSIELNPNFIEAIFNRGLEYKNLHEYQDAVDDFTRVIDLDPNDFSAYLNRGACKDALGDYFGGRLDKKKGVELSGSLE
ncbi:MAG TPA: tetratricopeptide repeat protein [Melioribacteraceae bacterium]|nr:tetratricopeptide repeat protein [Melioribacteraceae bacterium]